MKPRIMVAAGLMLILAGCGEGDDPRFASTVNPTPTAGVPSCAFHAGALPAETLPAGMPHGASLPIEHIIVLMQENRSFDSYFGRLPAAGKADVDGLSATATNPDANGAAVSVFHQTRYCTEDTNHSWTGSHLEFDGGKNDGFVLQNNPDGGRALGYYDESDLPLYYTLAKTFAIGDRYFSSLLGPTFPNRFYLMAGTSFGHIRNDMRTAGFAQPSIFGLLDAYGVSWKVYNSDFPFAALLQVNRRNLVRLSDFYTDAAAATLPQVAFVDPAIGLLGTETDEHPPANIQQGEQFASQVIQAVLDSPVWPTTAFFLLYDEHGGFYDHVPPPPACVPDAIAPLLDPADEGSNFTAQFDRYGFRVPVVVISPYAKPGFVSHTVYDHTSVLRFIETRFDLPALTDRDANAVPMLDLFDFAHPALINPPALPQGPLDPDRLQQCRTDFPTKTF